MSRIAVVGAGIAGLSAAWLLQRAHEVTLYETDLRAGGHADTQSVHVDGTRLAIDTGFIVLNDRNYPHLSGLFDALDVPTQDSEMSFAASIGGGRFEYGGGTLRQMVTQKSNLLKPRFWRMVRDILRFYREAPALLDDPGSDALTLGTFLDRGGYGAGFVRDHILPMGAAIWSASPRAIRDFPARQFVRFFHNHGLLTLDDRPQWRTVTGGSKVYVDRLLADLRGTVRLGCGVLGVIRGMTQSAGVTLRLADGTTRHVDQVVLACHADQALALLDAPSPAERRILGAIRCTDNLAVLHSDTSLMPRRRGVWSAWNYLAPDRDDNKPVCLTYWMNRLQNLATPRPMLVTLNPPIPPDPALVHATRQYRHPLFDVAALQAQRDLPAIQGRDLLWFAGAWTGWGFHEDGIASAVRIAEALGVTVPWATTQARPDAPAGRLAA